MPFFKLFNHPNLVFLLTGLLLHVFAPYCSAQNAGNLDMSFNYSDTGFGNGNGTSGFESYSGDVNILATQTDGKILIGGQFGTYKNKPARLMCRIFPNGDLDPNFQLNQIKGGSVDAIAVQTDGKILAGGFIYLTGQTMANSLYRFNQDGSLDNTFNVPISNYEVVSSIDIQPDGKIIIGGSFSAVQGISRKGIARLMPNGALDQTFDPGAGFDQEVYKVAFTQNGKILVGGRFTNFNNYVQPNFACLNENGSLNQSFTTGLDNTVHEIEIDQDNRILLGGDFSGLNGINRKNIMRLHPNGILDTTFTTGAGLDHYAPYSPYVSDIEIKPDGSIVVAGIFSKYNQQSVNSIVTLTPNGTLDQNFVNTQSEGGFYCLALQPDGGFIVGGSSYVVLGGIGRYGIGKLFANGEPDVQFNLGTGLNASVNELVAQPDGKIMVGGMFDLYYDQIRHGIVRINGNGSIDPNFGNHLSYPTEVDKIFLLPNGKMIVSGYIHQQNLEQHTTIARLHEDGAIDTSFNFGSNQYGHTYGLALQPDGKLIAVRYIDQTSNDYITSVLRLNQDGSIDSTFQSTLYDGQVRCAVLQPSGKIVIGGNFRFTQYLAESNLERLNTDGTIDNSFGLALGPGAKMSAVYEMEQQSDGKILVNGSLSVNSVVVRGLITRVHDNGSPDLSFNTGSSVSSGVWDIKIQPNGQVLVASEYTGGSVLSSEGIARFNSDGTFDYDFESGLGPYDRVYALETTPIDRILIGGDFVEYNGIGRNRLARLQGTSGGGNKMIKSFPVPFTDQMEIQIQDGGNKSGIADLYNLQGKMVESREVVLQAGQFTFPVSVNHESGVYILKVQLDNSVSTIKVCKN